MGDKEYLVYKHTTPDGQLYIGITCTDPEKRWRNGLGYKDTWFWKQGISVFGWENIDHEILYTGLTQAEAWQKERELIRKYHTWCPGWGFNDTLGGDSRGRPYPVRYLKTGEIFLTKTLFDKEMRRRETKRGERYFEWVSCKKQGDSFWEGTEE